MRLPAHLVLSADERACLQRFGPLLAVHAEAFSQEFYAALRQTPEIADFLDKLPPEKFQRLLQGQKDHFHRLTLSTDVTCFDAENAQLGKRHHDANVNPLWVFSGYGIYADALDRLAGQVDADLSTITLLRGALRKHLRADEYQQLAGYRDAVLTHLHEARQSSTQDALTGLPNRGQIAAQAARAITHAQDTQTQLAVIMLDLDDFKIVNDRYGHAAGDAVLSQLASRLRIVLRADDFAARYAGDEFVIILRDLRAETDATAVLDRLDQDLSLPYRFGGAFIACPATLGATLYPQDNGTVDDLLRHADRALYLAKSRKNERQRRWALYAEVRKMQQRASDLARDLPSTLRLMYQPIFDVRSGRCVRLEVLSRLQTQDGLLYPAIFLPQFNAQQKRDLFRAVLDRALSQIVAWGQQGNAWALAVNIEPFLPLGEDFIDVISAALVRHQLPPQRLTLEILEDSHDIETPEAIASYRKISELGVRLALDDLGVLHSNLGRLQTLPVDEVKLDQSFTKLLASQPQNLPFALNMLNLAQNMEVEFVAEGVEDDNTLEILINLGVQVAQGYGLCRPMCSDDIPQAIAAAEKRLAQRKAHAGILSAYAKHMAIETHLLGIFRHAPQHLHPTHLRDMSLCPLLPLLHGHPDMQLLHRRQHEIMAMLADRSAQHPNQLIQEYIHLGKQLRSLMATEFSGQTGEPHASTAVI